MSVEELKKEVVRRQRALPQLIVRRAALNDQIAELQGLGELQAAPKPARRQLGEKRARKTHSRMRAGSLANKLAEVFNGKKRLSLAETIEAVLAAGYKTKSKNFSTIVGNVLAKDKRFRRVRRGQYSLRG